MSGYRLFIGQLVKDVRRRELEDAFGKYGEIVRIDIKNGFGFIEYEHSRDAEEAVRKMDGEDFLGRRIIVEYARGKKRERDDRREYRRDNNRNNGPERSEYRVVVEGLGRGTSWQDLKDAFRSSGDILFTDVRRDRYDDYYGIVEFRRRDDIDQAIRKMEGAEINGYKIKVKEDKKRKKSRSRSEKRRRRTRSRSSDRKKSGSRDRSPRKRSSSPKKRSGSRDSSPKRRSGTRSPKRKSGSRSPRDRSPRRKSGSRSPKRKSGSRSPRDRSPKRSGSRDSKPRDDRKSEERNDNNKDNGDDNEQRDN